MLPENIQDFEAEKKALLRSAKNALKRSQNGIHKLEKQLEKTSEWQNIQHEGLLLQAHMFRLKRGMKDIEVQDWENENKPRLIALDATLEPKKQVEKFFKIARKLKAGKEPLQKALQKSLEHLEVLKLQLESLEKAQTLEDLQLFKVPPKVDKKLVKALPYHEFHSETGLQIWVGKNAKNNELLTFSLSNGSDWWLHVQGFPGSHVVIKTPKNREPDSEALIDAMQLALGYSKAKDQGNADILITQCKYVSRLGKGGSGKVQVSKHHIKRIAFDVQRFKKLQTKKAR